MVHVQECVKCYIFETMILLKIPTIIFVIIGVSLVTTIVLLALSPYYMDWFVSDDGTVDEEKKKKIKITSEEEQNEHP